MVCVKLRHHPELVTGTSIVSCRITSSSVGGRRPIDLTRCASQLDKLLLRRRSLASSAASDPPPTTAPLLRPRLLDCSLARQLPPVEAPSARGTGDPLHGPLFWTPRHAKKKKHT